MKDFLTKTILVIILVGVTAFWTLYVWHQRILGLSDPELAQMYGSDFLALYLPWFVIFFVNVTILRFLHACEGTKYPRIARVFSSIVMIFAAFLIAQFAGEHLYGLRDTLWS